jgi:hypothetical protein
LTAQRWLKVSSTRSTLSVAPSSAAAAPRPLERLEHLRQQVDHHAGGSAEPHAARAAFGLALDGLDGIVGVAQQLAPALDQRRAGRRGRDAAIAAHHQLRIEARFEFADVQAHRGLRKVQRLGRRREGAEIGDGDERAELVEVELSHQEC